MPLQELNPRHKATSEVLELLHENPLMILMPEGVWWIHLCPHSAPSPER